ncbi:unnamed protein product, partial [Mesorhabditis belari]|uniref:Exportin-5 n=1 Tax=Mesorhabditis belari TaxID=2138241 RepID=A0AAF3EXK7_9BILA
MREETNADNEVEFGVERIVDLCERIYGQETTQEDRQEAITALQEFISNPIGDLFDIASELFSHRLELQMIAWNLINYQLKEKWREMKPNRQKNVIETFSAFIRSPKALNGFICCEKAATACQSLIEQTFPSEWNRWTQAFDDVIAKKEQSTALALVMSILTRLLTEDSVVAMKAVKEKPTRNKLLHENLTKYAQTLMPRLSDFLPDRESLGDSNSNQLAVSHFVLGFFEALAERQIEMILNGNLSLLVCRIAQFVGSPITHDALNVMCILGKKRKGFEIMISEGILCQQLIQRIERLKEKISTNPHPFLKEYEFLKASMQLLITIGYTVAEVFDERSPALKWLIDTGFSLIHSPSLKLRVGSMEILGALLSGKGGKNSPDFLQKITDLAENVPILMEKELWPSFEPPTLTTSFSREDYTDDAEAIAEMNRCKMHFFSFIEAGCRWDLGRMVASAKRYFIDRLADEELIETEAENWGKYMKSILKSVQEKGKDRGIGGHVRIEDLEKLIGDWPALILRRQREFIKSSKWIHINGILSIVHSLLPIIVRNEGTLFEYLQMIREILVIEFEVEWGEIREKQFETKRHTLSGLLGCLESHGHLFAKNERFIEEIISIRESVTDRLTAMQEAVLSQLLAHLVNYPLSFHEKRLLLEKSLEVPKKFEQKTNLDDLVSFLGFDQYVEAPTGDEFAENRRTIRASLQALDGVLKVVKGGEERFEESFFEIASPLIVSLGQLSRLLLEYSYSDASKWENCFYDEDCFSQTPEIVSSLLGIPIDDVDEKYQEKIVDEKKTWPSINKKFYSDLHESILCTMVSAIRRFPQCLPLISPSLRAICWEKLHVFRLRIWIKRVWKEIAAQRAQHCRSASSDFWELFALITDSCLQVQIRESIELRSFDFEAADPILKEREYIQLIKEAIPVWRLFLLNQKGTDFHDLKLENDGFEVEKSLPFLLFSLHIQESQTVLKIAQMLRILLPIISKNSMLSKIKAQTTTSLLFLSLAQHYKEPQICNLLFDFFANFVLILHHSNDSYVDEAWKAFLNKATAKHFVERIEVFSRNDRQNEKNRRQFVKETIMEMIGDETSEYLFEKYQQNHLIFNNSNAFSIWK